MDRHTLTHPMFLPLRLVADLIYGIFCPLVYHDGDGSLGSLGLDKHDNEGLIQPDDLSQHGSLLGYVPSDPFAMDEPYLDSDSGAFSQEPPSPAQEGTESARSSFSKDAAYVFTLVFSPGLSVAICRKSWSLMSHCARHLNCTLLKAPPRVFFFDSISLAVLKATT